MVFLAVLELECLTTELYCLLNAFAMFLEEDKYLPLNFIAWLSVLDVDLPFRDLISLKSLLEFPLPSISSTVSIHFLRLCSLIISVIWRLSWLRRGECGSVCLSESRSWISFVASRGISGKISLTLPVGMVFLAALLTMFLKIFSPL